jgi:uncharacterized secreted protein with C-terminal beta-propeller domain
MTTRRSTCLSLCGLGAALLLAACDTGSKNEAAPGSQPSDVPPGEVVPGDDAEEFLSHVPGQSSENPASESADAGSAGGATADRDATDTSAERAIAEADILQRDGDTLYALSRYAGLSVIDIANPKQLKLRGRHRANAEPFEMYLRSGVVYIMYNNYGRYSFDEETSEWAYRSSSHVTALDVSDPEHIALIADHEVPGSISDSRLVGDILYLVTYESGWCWNCDSKPNTRVASFDMSEPERFEKIDELRFVDQEQGWSQRSIAVTSQRIYVGGPTWQNRDSNIQIVDIADPAGDLKMGAEIPLHGSVESRWQMDEYQGVLRVISQPTPWRSNDPPYVQTFRVESSSKVTALASLPVKLPRPEDLRSVRFDGSRAYAVTFEQIDPLFTFDLSDPAKPKQVGELEIPGFVYHMEPRGDRVYALGYDFQDTVGSLHVSIFDVAQLNAPTMLARVNFGGDWANLAEDQDRIHKAFNIMLDQELILVPFSGGEYERETCHYSYQSGIQLIDVDGDELTLRGVAAQVGSARRAFVHKDHLFGITDNAVSVFDIKDRSKPRATADLEVARNISQVHVMGDTLLRFGNDWWTQRSVIDFTGLDTSSTAEPLGELDLATLLEDEEQACSTSSEWEGQLYVHGDVAYAPRRGYRWEQNNSQETLTLYVIDLRDKTAPKLAGKIVTTIERSSGNGIYRYLGGVVLTDHALLIGRGEGQYRYDWVSGTQPEPKYAYDVYDLADPLKPKFTTRFDVPGRISSGGWGWGFGGCGIDMPWGFWYPGSGQSTGALVSGDLVVSQHEESVDDGSKRVRYFLDRLDVSDPSAPKLLPQINIPGQVVHFDGEEKRLVTLEYTYSEQQGLSREKCYGQGNRAYLDEQSVCRIYRRRANALVLEGDSARRVSMVELDGDKRSSGSISVTNQRLFVTTHPVRAEYSPGPSEQQLETFAFSDGGQFVRLPPLELEGTGYWGGLSARDARAFMSSQGSLTVIDTADTEAPKLTRHDMQGWGCSSLEVHGDRAFCALGQFGVFSVDL